MEREEQARSLFSIVCHGETQPPFPLPRIPTAPGKNERIGMSHETIHGEWKVTLQPPLLPLHVQNFQV